MKTPLGLVLLLASALAAAGTTVVDVPGPHDLFKGSKKIGTYLTHAACVDAAKALAVAAKYTCRNSTDVTVAVTTDPKPPAPPPMPGIPVNPATVPVWNNGVNEERVSNPKQFPNPSDEGGFRTVCAPSHTSNDDPLVFPGQQGASHHHTFYGNGGTDYRSTADSIANSGDSTCRGGTINRTSYWAPSMVDPLGNYIVPQSMIIYYKNSARIEQSGHPTYAAFPPGLRMIAGNSKAMSAAESAGLFTCIDASGSGAHYSNIPACAPGNTLWQSVEFPSCWDGKNLDSPDHKSHMAYPIEVQAFPNPWSKWVCPSTHLVLLPTITTNVLYAIKPGQDTTKWRLASDMYDKSLPGGYSSHSDWWDGWKPAINAAWVAGCNNAQKDCQAQMLGDGRVLDSFGANQ